MRVPTYDNFQVAPNALPQPRFDSPNMPDVAGQQMQQMGAGLQKFGADLGALAKEIQKDADESRVQEAYNKLRKRQVDLEHDPNEGFTNVRGEAALPDKKTGKTLSDRYQETFDGYYNELAGGLTSENQKKLFAQHAQAARLSFVGGLKRHESNQIFAHTRSVADSTAKVEIEFAAKNWRDPDAVEASIGNVSEAYNRAARLGLIESNVELKAAKEAAVSHIRAGVVVNALANGQTQIAKDYLNKHKDEIQVNELLKLNEQIGSESRLQFAQQRVADVAKVAIPTGTPWERFTHALEGMESNHQHFNKDGTPKIGWVIKPDGTKREGGIGLMQVTARTGPEAAKLAGLDWDENRLRNDPAYNKALGNAYAAYCLKEFGGDMEKAAAAYNAGPDGVRRALAKEAKNQKLAANDPAIAKTWKDFLPGETQKYLLNLSKRLNTVGSAPQMPTKMEFVGAAVAGVTDPKTRELVQRQAEHQYGLIEDDRKSREAGAMEKAQSVIYEAGGNWDAAIKNIDMGAIPASKIDELKSYAEKIGKKAPIDTDPVLYTNLRALAVDNPEQFGKTNLLQYYHKLAPADRERLLNLQEKVKDPKNHGDLQTLSQQLKQSHGLLKLKNKEDQAKFDLAVENELAAWQRENGGKYPSYKDREIVIKRMMLPVNVKSWLSYFSPFSISTEKKTYEVVGTADEKTMRYEIPSEDKELIIEALQKNKMPVTDANIRREFKLMHGIK